MYNSNIYAWFYNYSSSFLCNIYRMYTHKQLYNESIHVIWLLYKLYSLRPIIVHGMIITKATVHCMVYDRA